MLELLRSTYLFGRGHSTAVIVMFVLTAFLGDAKNFIFVESKFTFYTQINLALLAVSRSILGLAISYTTHSMLTGRLRCAYYSATSCNQSACIDAIAILSTLWGPRFLLKSILCLLVFALPFLFILYTVQKLIERCTNYCSGGNPNTHRVTLTPGLRTRSGFVICSVNDEIRRLRSNSKEKKTLTLSSPRTPRKSYQSSPRKITAERSTPITATRSISTRSILTPKMTPKKTPSKLITANSISNIRKRQ